MNPSPMFSMWTHPRATMRALLDAPKRSGAMFLLAAYSGVYQAYSKVTTQTTQTYDPHNPLSWLVILLAGSISGLIGLYFCGWLLKVTGRWAGGQGTTATVRQAWAWSTIPAVAMLPLLVIEFFLFGDSLFSKNPTLVADTTSLHILEIALYILQVVLSVWGIIVFLACFAEAHRFSMGKALLASVYAGLLIFAGLMIVFVIAILLGIASR